MSNWFVLGMTEIILGVIGLCVIIGILIKGWAKR